MAKYYRIIPNTLECKDCAYCWKEEGDDYPRCQWHGNNYCPDDVAPCEETWTEEISAAEYYGYDEEEDGYNAENEIFSAQAEAELKYL